MEDREILELTVVSRDGDGEVLLVDDRFCCSSCAKWTHISEGRAILLRYTDSGRQEQVMFDLCGGCNAKLDTLRELDFDIRDL